MSTGPTGSPPSGAPPVTVQARSASVYTVGVWNLTLVGDEFHLWTADGFLWHTCSDSNGFVHVAHGDEQIIEWSAGSMGTRAVAPATALGDLTESVAGCTREPCLQSVGDSLTLSDDANWTLTRLEDNFVEATCKQSAVSDMYRFSTELPGFMHFNSRPEKRCVSTVTLQAPTVSPTGTPSSSTAAIRARSASVYTIGVWTLSVGDGELKLWTANGFLWVLRSASNGWVDVKNGSEEITEWSAGGMGTRAVAPATALGGLTESVAGRPRQPCLQSFGDSFTFGDQGTWNLTRRDGNYVEITCKHSPAHNLYRFSTERPGFKHMNWGGCVSTVTLQEGVEACSLVDAPLGGPVRVGDLVQLTSGYRSCHDAVGGPLQPGQVGRVIADDSQPPVPLQVEYKGREWWYSRDALERASQGAESASGPARPLRVGDSVRLTGSTAMGPLQPGQVGRVVAVDDSDSTLQIVYQGREWWFSFGNLERAPSEGPEPGSPAATGTTADLRVGDFVKLAEGYAAHSDASSGPMRPGQAGVVVSRGSEGRVPFRVRVKQLGPDGPTGAEWWYDVQAISKVSKAEADEMVAGAASNIYPDLHPHPLRPSEHNASHACDGCNAYPLGQGGARCVSGCDFDLCRACYARGGASSAARPLGRSPSEARRPTVGDFVQLAPGFETLRDAANGPLKPGLVGRVVIDDSTPPTPLRVIYKGHEWWYCREALERVAQAPSTPDSSRAPGTQATLSVGDFVRLADGYAEFADASEGPMRPGQAGVIVARRDGDDVDDALTCGVRRLGPDGPTGLARPWYYEERALVRVTQAEADEMAAAGPTENSGSEAESDDISSAASDDDAEEAAAAAAGPPLPERARAGAPVAPTNAVVGLRVVRGPDWRWQNQDGAEGNVGTITSVTDVLAGYRYRVGEASDLSVALAEGAETTPGALGNAAAVGSLSVGASVVLSSVFSSFQAVADGPLKPNDVGVVVEIDSSATPIHVRAADGQRWWYPWGALAAAPQPGMLSWQPWGDAGRIGVFDLDVSAALSADTSFRNGLENGNLRHYLDLSDGDGQGSAVRADFSEMCSRVLADIAKHAREALVELGGGDLDSNCTVLVVRRTPPEALLKDSMAQLGSPRACRELWLRPIKVTFKGENGIDAGGLTREWFSLVSTALLSSPVLRRTENETAYEYYLNPLAQTEEAQAEAEFIGGFLAKALLETAVPERAARHGLVTLGSLRLCTVLYKHLLGLPVEFSDLRHIAPSEFSALKNVLTLSDPAMKVEDLLPGTCFVHEDHSVTPPREVPLKPLGKMIQVRNANISEYAMLKAQYILQKAAATHIEALGMGFFSVVSAEAVFPAMLTAPELRLLLCGVPRVDLRELKPLTEYKGEYNPSHRVIKWFWDALERLSPEKQLCFLRFYSAAEAVPVQGFASLSPGRAPLTVGPMDVGDAAVANLPVAHTCFCTLDLPVYKSKAELRERLNRVLDVGLNGGFGIA